MQGTNVHVTNVAPGPVVMGAGVNALRGDGVSDKVIEGLKYSIFLAD